MKGLNPGARVLWMLWTGTFLVLNLHWGNLWWTALFGVLFGMDIAMWCMAYSVRHRPQLWLDKIQAIRASS